MGGTTFYLASAGLGLLHGNGKADGDWQSVAVGFVALSGIALRNSWSLSFEVRHEAGRKDTG